MENLENYFGVSLDTRTIKEKALDYKHSDVYGGIVNWVKKDINTLKKYTKRDQSSSLSCVAQSGAKGIETLISKIMSAHPPYRSRSNYPTGGMWTQNLGDILKNIGTNLEVDDQSQNQGESLLNRDITVPTPYKIKGYLQPNSKNIDEIAQAIENWGHCVIIFHANNGEWQQKPIYNGLPVNFGHAICAVDYFLDENGVKCLWIEDSASLLTSIKEDGHRIITEEYLKWRCSSAIYFLGVNPLELPFIFTETLKLGSRGLQVKKLQQKLNLTQDGIFGTRTRLAVIAYQIKNKLSPDGIVGPKTRLSLNS